MRVGAVKISAERHAGLLGEIRRVDDQRVAFPVPNRVSRPEANACGKMLAPVHGDHARDVLGRVDDEVVPGKHVFLREDLDAAEVVELAVADLILVAVGVFPAAVPLRQRPRLVGDDAVWRVDDQGRPGRYAEPCGMIFEDDRVRHAAGRSVPVSRQVRFAVRPPRNRTGWSLRRGAAAAFLAGGGNRRHDQHAQQCD